jgi:hypothetical protein
MESVPTLGSFLNILSLRSAEVIIAPVMNSNIISAFPYAISLADANSLPL